MRRVLDNSYALTVKPPWSHLIAHHGKDVENRSWMPHEGVHTLLIHAGKSWDNVAGVSRDGVATGAFVAVADLAFACNTSLHTLTRRCECSVWAQPEQCHWNLINFGDGMTKPGTRVWAISHADTDTIWAYGFGTYLGDQRRTDEIREADLDLCRKVIVKADADGPIIDAQRYYADQVAAGKLTAAEAAEKCAEQDAAWAAELARPIDERARKLAEGMYMNPKIRLDDGGIVWGYECWWGPADDDTPAGYAKGRAIVIVPAPHPADGAR